MGRIAKAGGSQAPRYATGEHDSLTRPLVAQVAAARPPDQIAQAIRTSPVMQARRAAMAAAFGVALEPAAAIQRVAKSTGAGLPENLKANVEARSGLSMDDVQVHYNSAKPAQVQALAYAQGTQIHLAPGQERHLPHEAWHVVQQKQGRVKPTLQMKGVAINDDSALEREADRVGSTLQRRAAYASREVEPWGAAAAYSSIAGDTAPIQRVTIVVAMPDVEVDKLDLLTAGTDNGIISRAHNLAKSKGVPLLQLKNNPNLSGLGNDTLFIYGHGYGSGGAMALSAADLAQRLAACNLKAGATIELMGCSSGNKYILDVTAELIKKGLAPKKISGAIVPTTTDEKGQNFVLDPVKHAAAIGMAAPSGVAAFDPLAKEAYNEKAQATMGSWAVWTPMTHAPHLVQEVDAAGKPKIPQQPDFLTGDK